MAVGVGTNIVGFQPFLCVLVCFDRCVCVCVCVCVCLCGVRVCGVCVSPIVQVAEYTNDDQKQDDKG